jgi:hypothetical protein
MTVEKSQRSFGMTIRSYRSDDFPSVRELYSRVWKDQRGFDYDRVRMRDTFDGLPVATVAHFKQELGGFFTIWPMPLSDGRQSVAGGQAMDVMTDERFRGKGVFPSLAVQAALHSRDRGMKVLYGVPNEAVFETYIKRLSWATPTQVRTCVRMLSLRGKHRLLGLADPLLGLLPSGRSSGFQLSDERPSDTFLLACLAGHPRRRGTWRVERSQRWYDFRYQENERFTYRWATISSETRGNAFAIWGIERTGGGHLRRANLLDIIGTTPDAQRAAVAASCLAAKHAGAGYIAATTTSQAMVRWLRKTSFISIKRSPLIVKTLDPSAFNANPFMENAWDLFGGDFDFV